MVTQIHNSSWISAIAYNTKRRELTIKTKGGKNYTYERVAPKTYTELINALSVGSAVSDFILGRKD